MINEITVLGSRSTTLHDFTLVQVGMDLLFSNGSYVQNNAERFTTDLGATVTIPSPASDTHYEVWLNDVGLVILPRSDGEEFGEVVNPIDRLAWFTVPANATSLDSVEISFIKVVSEDGSQASSAESEGEV
jgi:hypothetical protein